ncbi:reverse transcriptase domain-containing protein [Tanacetum coccineum]
MTLLLSLSDDTPHHERNSETKGMEEASNGLSEATINKSETSKPEAPTFAITTRSGIITQDPPFPAPPRPETDNLIEKERPEDAELSITQEPAPRPSILYQPSKTSNLPFPSKLKKQKNNDEDERLLSIFKQIYINLPFLEAMIHMPKGAKVLKDLLSHKEKLKKAASLVKLSEECFDIIQRSLPQKEGDPGSFTLPCLIGPLAVKNALADLGAINHDGKWTEDEEEEGSNKALAVSFYPRTEPVEPLEWKALENRLRPSNVEPPKLELKELPEYNNPWVSPVQVVPKKGGMTVVKNEKDELILQRTVTGWHVYHSTLRYLFTKQDVKPCLIRWILLLQEFNIEFRDKKGAENLAADHRSRLENPDLGKLTRAEIRDLFPEERLMEISDENNEPCVLIESYEDAWPEMKQHKFFNSVTADHLDDTMASPPPQGKFSRPDSTGHISFAMHTSWDIFPLQTETKYILVAIDYVSKWVEAQAFPTSAARNVVNFLRRLFTRFGIPKALINDRGTHFCNHQMEKAMKRKDWSYKLDDALWAFRTAFKTPLRTTSFRIIYDKACYLPVELEHKAYWAIKNCNMDLTKAGKNRFLQINELDEIWLDAYESSISYKERTKRWNDKRIKLPINQITEISINILFQPEDKSNQATAYESPTHSSTGTRSEPWAPPTAWELTVSCSISLPDRGSFHPSLTVLLRYRSPRSI